MDKRVCAGEKCKTILNSYNKDEHCYSCQDEGRERTLFQSRPHRSIPLSGGRIARTYRQYNGSFG